MELNLAELKQKRKMTAIVLKMTNQCQEKEQDYELKHLCFTINQLRPSCFALKYPFSIAYSKLLPNTALRLFHRSLDMT